MRALVSHGARLAPGKQLELQFDVLLPRLARLEARFVCTARAHMPSRAPLVVRQVRKLRAVSMILGAIHEALLAFMVGVSLRRPNPGAAPSWTPRIQAATVRTFRMPNTPQFQLGHEDAVKWLRRFPDASVDLVVTDPPYESLEKHRSKGTTTRLKHSKASSNDWFKIFPNDRFEELFIQLYRVLKKDRHFYLFCDQETMFVAKPIGERVGFRFWKPLVWDKQKMGMGYHYRARYELILFFEKGKRKLNNLGIPDILSAARIHRGYPTEKPPEIAQILIEQSTAPGEIVIDPFMGSGSTGVGAARCGRDFAGNDIGAEALTIARERLLASGATLAIETPTSDEEQLALPV